MFGIGQGLRYKYSEFVMTGLSRKGRKGLGLNASQDTKQILFCAQCLLNLLFLIACYGMTIEIPPLKKGVRGIWKFRFPLNTLQLAAGIFIEK